MHTNQKLLVDLLLSKGASYEVLDSYEELLEISYKDKKDFLQDRFSSVVSYHSVKMTADKFFTKKMLIKNNISCPQGEIFTSNTYNDAIQFAKNLFPVVLKPNWGSHGDYVVVDINSIKELEEAIFNFYKNHQENEPFIIEKFYPWKEYRLFVTHLGGFAVINREWSNVIGNGINTIVELIEIENIKRKNLKETINTSLCPIVIDNEVHVFLHKNNRTIKTIPTKNEKVYLRQESNLAKGGVSINVTEEISPFFKELALKTLSIFPGLKLAGLDVLTTDIKSKNPEYVILEVNSNPGLTMHHYPAIGKDENVAQLVCDVMFPNWFI
jgi:D-alanine-D-alanine ligase-like ATP-grasp enzyme